MVEEVKDGRCSGTPITDPGVTVLRKSFGRYSAGTRVTFSGDVPITPGAEVVEAFYTDVEYYTDWDGRRAERIERISELFEIHPDHLVTLRPASCLVPAIARINRPDRVARRMVYNMKGGSNA